VIVDKDKQKIRFIFDATKADSHNLEIGAWLNSVEQRIGLGPLDPEPYWGFEDLKYAIGSKIKNCFYVIADIKVEAMREYFNYRELYSLSGFSFDKFIMAIEENIVFIDFDARTGHNHGTKFRILQNHWQHLFSEVKRVI